MSRKTLMFIIGFIEAMILFFQQQFGLEIDVTVIVAALTNVSAYILFRAKHDLNKLRKEKRRFRDKKFWIAFVSAVIVPIISQLGINIPFLSHEAIIGVLTAIMAGVFGKDYVKAKET